MKTKDSDYGPRSKRFTNKLNLIDEFDEMCTLARYHLRANSCRLSKEYLLSTT